MSTKVIGPFRRLAPSATAPTIDSETGRATFVFNTEEVGRDGHVVYNRGIHAEHFESNPVILFAHDDKQPPIARATAVRIGEPASKVDIEFTPMEIYPFGATIGDLVRGGYLNSCSMSWQPLKWKFSTDRGRVGGVDFEEVDLLEISIVPVPALPDALATARASGIDTRPLYEWAERLLDKGGMLLVPRTELETLRRAAKMPAAAKSTPKPAADPKAVVTRAIKTKHDRALSRSPKTPVFKRGLYDVAQLCYALSQLGYLHDSAEYEAALEEDASPVPAMLGEGLVKIGEALIAMTQEEVAELLDDVTGGDGIDDGVGVDVLVEVETRALPAEAQALIAEGPTPRARAWRAGIAVARAGKALSSSNEEKLQDAQGHQERAMKHSRAQTEHHAAVADHLKKAGEATGNASDANDKVGEHLQAAQDNPDDAQTHVKRAAKAQQAVDGHLDDADESHTDLADRHEDVGDSQRAMARCVQSAQRCVSSVVDGADSKDDDDDDDDDDADDDSPEAKERAARARRASLLKIRGTTGT